MSGFPNFLCTTYSKNDTIGGPPLNWVSRLQGYFSKITNHINKGHGNTQSVHTEENTRINPLEKNSKTKPRMELETSRSEGN